MASFASTRLHDYPTSASFGFMQLMIPVALEAPPQNLRTSASHARADEAACVSLFLQGCESLAMCESKHA